MEPSITGSSGHCSWCGSLARADVAAGSKSRVTCHRWNVFVATSDVNIGHERRGASVTNTASAAHAHCPLRDSQSSVIPLRRRSCRAMASLIGGEHPRLIRRPCSVNCSTLAAADSFKSNNQRIF